MSTKRSSFRQITPRQSSLRPTNQRRHAFERLEDRRMLAVVTVDTNVDVVDFNDGVTSLREAIFATNLVDGVDTQGRCVGRYYAQAPDIDGICYLSEPRPPGTFVTGKIVGWEDYDLLVRPE